LTLLGAISVFFATTTKANWSINQSVEKPGLSIYTDGSVMDNKAGYGWSAIADGLVVEPDRQKRPHIQRRTDSHTFLRLCYCSKKTTTSWSTT